MKFRVWATVVEAFDYCWRERRAMVRFGWIPLAIVITASIAVDAILAQNPNAFQIEGMRRTSERMPETILGLVQALAYLCLSVTWYRLVVLGPAESVRRPMFTLGRLEIRLLGWQFLSLLAFLIVGVGGTLVIMAIYASLAASGHEIAATIVAVVLGGALLMVILFTAMRLAMVLVLVALDKPVDIAAAWHMTTGLGWRLCGALIIIIAGSLVLTAVGYLLGMLFGMIGGIALETTADKVSTFINIVFESATGLLISLVTATLFGFVYRLVTTPATPEIQPVDV